MSARPWFVSVIWQHDPVNGQRRMNEKKDRRRTETIMAESGREAVALAVDAVMGRPNKPGRRRRITWTGATPL